MQTRDQKGFTLLETILTLLILSILSAAAYYQFNKMIASNQLEKAAWSVWKNLSDMRPMVMKFDQTGIVKFKNRSYIINKISSIDTCKLPDFIGFGVSGGSPTKSPFGATITSDSGGKGSWKDSLVVNRDAIGTINSGYVIISSSRINKVGYFIGVSDSLQVISMYKWTGSSWVKL